MTVEELKDALTLFDPQDIVRLPDGQELGKIIYDDFVLLLPKRW